MTSLRPSDLIDKLLEACSGQVTRCDIQMTKSKFGSGLVHRCHDTAEKAHAPIQYRDAAAAR